MRQILAVAAGLAVLAVSGCSAPAPPRSDAPPSATPTGPPALPTPTGAQPVGTTAFHVKDTSRPDPWNLDADARELKVTLWYPTDQRGGERAPYMTPKESEITVRRSASLGVSFDTLSKTRTNAIKDAEPAGKKLPLVVLSPGFTNSLNTLTSLAEELASHGYVVAGIDHAYESHAMTLANGQVAECLACDTDNDAGFGARLVAVRAADVSFVLDQLPSKWDGSSRIDRSRIAMVGKSIGGASTVAAMVKDRRIRAGINLDGTTYARIPKSGLARPFLFLAAAGNVPGGPVPTWDRDWKLLTGWKRWIVLTGTEHQSFSDVPILQEAMGGKPAYGIVPAARASELTRTYVAAFLDQHLKSKRQPLLDKPSSRFPEAKLCAATCG